MFLLKDRAILEISGLDRQEFLQGLITNDIKLATSQKMIYSAFLNGAGRFFVDFFIHEIVIHQRFKLFRNWNNKYILGIRRAHKIHHKHLGKEEGENFGMLVVPFRYFKHDSKKIIE